MPPAGIEPSPHLNSQTRATSKQRSFKPNPNLARACMFSKSAGNQHELVDEFAGNLCVPQQNSQETGNAYEHDENHEDPHPEFSRKIQMLQK